MDFENKENFFQKFFETIPISLLITNDKGRIIYSNKFTRELFGYTKKELAMNDLGILIPERLRKLHTGHYSNYLKSPEARPMGKGRDLFAVRKNGDEFPVEIGLSPLRYNKDNLVIASIIDISSRKKSEQLLKENESKLKSILDNSPDSIIVYDKEGKILEVNREAEIIFFKNKKLDNILEIIPIEHQNSFRLKTQQAMEGKKIIDWETERLLKDGESLVVSSSITYSGKDPGIFIETLRDITDRVLLREKIIEYEKAQVFAKISEGIAHHMGTPLSSMLLRIQMMKEDIKKENTLDKNYIDKLEHIETQIKYCKKIMLRLLKFSIETSTEKTKVDLAKIVDNSVDVLGPLLKRQNIEVRKHFDRPFNINADHDMIELVVSDILMNSIDALSKGGFIDIRILKEKENITLSIRDNGVGIPKKVLPYVFEPFYTTKAPGKGTGLGLSVAKNIVTEHKGKITLNSSDGNETIVNIILPEYK